jgi:hypothetical protein
MIANKLNDRPDFLVQYLLLTHGGSKNLFFKLIQN